MSMITRVARAIYEDRHGKGCVPWSRRSSAHKAPYLSDARAAIKAMMEPTDAVIAAVEAEAEERYRAAPEMQRWYGDEVFIAGLRAALEAKGGKDG